MATTIVVCQSGSVGQRQMVGLMYPPMHVLYLAGYLRHHVSGADVRVVDAYSLSVHEAAQQIVEYRPDILFIHGDTPTTTGMYEVVDRVKATMPHHFLAVIFGEHPSALPMEPFERCRCDVVMLGDPEPTAGAVCGALMSGGAGMEAFAGVQSIEHCVPRS